MQFTALTLATLASSAFAQSTPILRFSEYGNGAKTCDDTNLISPSVNIPGTGVVGNCIQFPKDTSAVQYKLLEGSKIGCKVDLYTNNSCNEAPGDSFVPSVGSTTCKPPPKDKTWLSVRVTCP